MSMSNTLLPSCGALVPSGPQVGDAEETKIGKAEPEQPHKTLFLNLALQMGSVCEGGNLAPPTYPVVV